MKYIPDLSKSTTATITCKIMRHLILGFYGVDEADVCPGAESITDLDRKFSSFIVPSLIRIPSKHHVSDYGLRKQHRRRLRVSH